VRRSTAASSDDVTELASERAREICRLPNCTDRFSQIHPGQRQHLAALRIDS
jgi:hypothetical protein